jgi:hypothetical protein
VASGAASGTPATAGEGETAGLLVRPEEGVGILVVEDEGPVRRTAARALRRLGYRVHEAADVAEGLRAFAEHRDEIALVLTDMVMPGEMSGLELGARLRAMSPGVEIVLMTGYCVELGELGELAPHPPRLLLKPFTLATLRDTVQEVLRGGGEGEGADRQVAG